MSSNDSDRYALYLLRPVKNNASDRDKEQSGRRKAAQKPICFSNETVAIPDSPPMLTPL